MTTEEPALKRALINKIEECVENHPDNRTEGNTPYFEAPLIGFASADDELFTRYQSIIGPFHWTPSQVLAQAYGSGAPAARTVISWILPVVGETRLSNRKESRYPSRKWARTRHYGELFNDILRKTVVDLIVEQGHRAAAPMLLTEWSRIDDPEIGLASTWSERHAAFAAGLGTFSLSDGFITPRGIAHRVGSVVLDVVIEPSPRLTIDHRENCLTCRGLECGVCITRCPAGAISHEGHDKGLCREYTYGPAFRKLSKRYGARHVGCGLCQTDVPCEDQIPEGSV